MRKALGSNPRCPIAMTAMSNEFLTSPVGNSVSYPAGTACVVMGGVQKLARGSVWGVLSQQVPSWIHIRCLIDKKSRNYTMAGEGEDGGDGGAGTARWGGEGVVWRSKATS